MLTFSFVFLVINLAGYLIYGDARITPMGWLDAVMEVGVLGLLTTLCESLRASDGAAVGSGAWP